MPRPVSPVDATVSVVTGSQSAKRSGFSAPRSAVTTGLPYPGTASNPRPVTIGHRRTPGAGGDCVFAGGRGHCNSVTSSPSGHRECSAREGTTARLVVEATITGRRTATRYLLCMDCEQHLGRAENYLSVICRGQRRNGESRPADRGGGRLHGVDAGLVTRALLGIALKAHFAQAGQFAAAGLNLSIWRISGCGS